MKRTLLITGFDPFGGAAVNPAWQAVQLLPKRIGDFEVHKLGIPTVFGKGAALTMEAAEAIRPHVILCIGQAGGRDAVTPERIAVNIRDARIPDNAGNRPCGERITADGPAAYFSTLDPVRMRDAILAAGIEATVSNSAGAFVCNDTLYSLLHHYLGSSVLVGFIHVPWLPEQGTPNLTLGDTVAALEAAIVAMHREASV